MTETHWQYEFGDALHSRRGEAGKVIGRSETRSSTGIITQRFQIEGTPDKWGETFRAWLPAHSLERDDSR